MKKIVCTGIVLLLLGTVSCDPVSIKPAGADLYFSLEYIPYLEEYTADDHFQYIKGRNTDRFAPGAGYGKLIPYIGMFFHEYREYLPVFGFVDADGYMVTDAVFPSLDTFTLTDGTELFVAAYDQRNSFVIPQNGEWTLECKDYNKPIAYDNSLFGIINENQSTGIFNADGVLQRVIDGYCAYSGSDLCVVSPVSGGMPSSYRLMHPDGGYINDITYYYFSGFRSGLASVSVKTSPVRREYSAALIDTSGNNVIGPTVYKTIDIGTIDTGILKVSDNNNRYGIIDINGNELVPCLYPILRIESASPLIFTTGDKRINYTEGTETEYKSGQERPPPPDFGDFDYRMTVCGYTCAVLREYTYVFDSRGELLLKKLIQETD